MDPILIAVIAAVVLVVVGVVAVRARSGGTSALDDLPEGDSGELLAAPASTRPKADAPTAAPAEPAGPSLFGRLVDGLARTKGRMVSRIDDLFGGKAKIDDELWAQLEELLITSDVGVHTTNRLLEKMRHQAGEEGTEEPARLRQLLADGVRELLVGNAGALAEAPKGAPLVIMVVGVNGAGKTTTIGKLAARHTAAGRKVIIAAGDTFRAAAIEQVVVWGKRAGAEVVKHSEGGDPAAVAHDAVSAGLARNADVVICDTAGRLHSKSGLMQELQKVHRVIG